MSAPSPPNSVLQPPMITQRRERGKRAEGPELCGEWLGVWTPMALLLGFGSSKVSGNSVYVCVGGAVTEEYCLQDNDLRPHHPPPHHHLHAPCPGLPPRDPSTWILLLQFPPPAHPASARVIPAPAACAGWGRGGEEPQEPWTRQVTESTP